MSDLFELPESPLPPLEAARRQVETWETLYKDASTPKQIALARVSLARAKALVARLEQEAMRK